MQTPLTEKQKAYVERIEYNTQGLTAISTGLCGGCEACLTEFGKNVDCDCCCQDEWCDRCHITGERPPTEEEFASQAAHEEVLCEGYFSSQPCELCGSGLGGNREPWHGVDEDGNIVHGDYACVNCTMYLANGEVPDDAYLPG